MVPWVELTNADTNKPVGIDTQAVFCFEETDDTCTVIYLGNGMRLRVLEGFSRVHELVIQSEQEAESA